MTYPEIEFLFGCLSGGFVLGWGYPREWWMRGKVCHLSIFFFTRDGVRLDLRFSVFLRVVLLSERER